MKNIKNSIFFFCILALGSVFSYVSPAAAHSDEPHEDSRLTATASDVSDERTLENFVKHAAAHLQESRTFKEATRVLYEFRNPGGDWNSASTFLVLLTRRGGVYIHASNRNLEDQDWSDLADASGKNVGEMFLNQEEGFVEYRGSNGTPKRSYSFSFSAPSVPLSNPFAPERQEFVLIGGFDYEPPPVSDKVSYEQLADLYNLRQLSPVVQARDVNTRDNLVQFVEEAILFFTRALAAGGGGNIARGSDIAGNDDIDIVLLRRMFRLEGGPWREGSTYLWITEGEGNLIFHGADRDVEQKNILDGNADNPDILEIIQELIEAGKQGGGFVEYNWDDPNVVGDEPADGSSGGSSPKLGYAKAIQINKDDADAKPIYYIFGSGIYFPQQTMGPSGGCTILTQAGNTSQSAFLNLFLVLSGIFSFVLIQRRD